MNNGTEANDLFFKHIIEKKTLKRLPNDTDGWRVDGGNKLKIRKRQK